MWNVVEQAKLMYEGQGEFLHWLYGLVGACEVPVLDYYSTGTVYVDLFGVRHRIYQQWEKEEGFPVPEPERRKLPVVKVVGRAYTPTQVAQIAFWVWSKRQEGGGVDAEPAAHSF